MFYCCLIWIVVQDSFCFFGSLPLPPTSLCCASSVRVSVFCGHEMFCCCLLCVSLFWIVVQDSFCFCGSTRFFLFLWVNKILFVFVYKILVQDSFCFCGTTTKQCVCLFWIVVQDSFGFCGSLPLPPTSLCCAFSVHVSALCAMTGLFCGTMRRFAEISCVYLQESCAGCQCLNTKRSDSSKMRCLYICIYSCINFIFLGHTTWYWVAETHRRPHML